MMMMTLGMESDHHDLTQVPEERGGYMLHLLQLLSMTLRGLIESSWYYFFAFINSKEMKE